MSSRVLRRLCQCLLSFSFVEAIFFRTCSMYRRSAFSKSEFRDISFWRARCDAAMVLRPSFRNSGYGLVLPASGNASSEAPRIAKASLLPYDFPEISWSTCAVEINRCAPYSVFVSNLVKTSSRTPTASGTLYLAAKTCATRRRTSGSGSSCMILSTVGLVAGNFAHRTKAAPILSSMVLLFRSSNSSCSVFLWRARASSKPF